MFGQLTENKLVHNRENVLFVISLLTSILIYVSLAVSIIGLIYLAIIGTISLFVNFLTMTHIRNNAVRLNERQFGDIYAKVVFLSKRMGLEKVPDVFVIESGGVLNAFAARFFRKNMVILNSSIFEVIKAGKNEELLFVIAHELAHVKRNHITKFLLVLPALWIPFIGYAYSRACEFTCDRMATYYVENVDASVNALAMLAIGRELVNDVNLEDYVQQFAQHDGFIQSIGASFSTHPPLPKRIAELANFFNYENEALYIREDGKKKLIYSIAAVFVTIVVGLGAFIGFDRAMNSALLAEFLLTEGATPLMLAASEGDMVTVENLLIEGADPNAQDSYGWTALDWALMETQNSVLPLLLQYGADPNRLDEYGEMVITQAIYAENIEAIEILLEGGAEVNLQDTAGWTPLMVAASIDNVEIAELLLKVGADPTLVDDEGNTAFDHANLNKSKNVYKLLSEM